MAKEIKNYLKSVKDITAPLNWKSSPDSPPTQLAYVTQPEIDMLVKANIHGSMNGKPNMGPKGIISLDGGGSYAAETKTDKNKKGSSTGASQVQATQQQQQNFAEKVASQGGTSAYESSGQADQSEIDKVKSGEKKVESSKDEPSEEDERSGYQKFLDTVMGSKGDTSVKKSSFEKSGKHPLRAQLDYLMAKYGDSFKDTQQGKELMGYLAGVPVERGGGLGAQDENYGLIDDEAKEFQIKLSSDDVFMDAQNYRNRLLGQVAGGEFDFSNINPERASEGLSPEQYYNFRQQLMAADPTAENKTYKDAFPFSSGAGLGAIAERVIPGANAISAITGGILPERNMTGYQGTNDPFASTFRALPQSQNSSSGVMSMPAFAIAPGQDAPPKPGPGFTPDEPSGPSFTPQNTSPFDLSQFYAGLPSYSYGQQGVMSPNINPDLASYFENLKKYYGVG